MLESSVRKYRLGVLLGDKGSTREGHWQADELDQSSLKNKIKAPSTRRTQRKGII